MDGAGTEDAAPEPPGPPGVTVYWRPGCPYCVRLRRGLARAGVPTTEVNIWEDPAGAAVVRAAAGGNETVPTVVIGGTVLVNPGVHQVAAALAGGAPSGGVPAGGGWVARARRALGG